MKPTWGTFFGLGAGIYSALCFIVLMMMIPVFDCGYQLIHYGCPIYSPSDPIVAWSLVPGLLIGFIYIYNRRDVLIRRE